MPFLVMGLHTAGTAHEMRLQPKNGKTVKMAEDIQPKCSRKAKMAEVQKLKGFDSSSICTMMLDCIKFTGWLDAMDSLRRYESSDVVLPKVGIV